MTKYVVVAGWIYEDQQVIGEYPLTPVGRDQAIARAMGVIIDKFGVAALDATASQPAGVFDLLKDGTVFLCEVKTHG